jgi:hypothetical protein
MIKLFTIFYININLHLHENDYEVNITLKKREGQEKQDLEDFHKKLQDYKYDKTICLDESSIYLNMSLSYDRSKSGTRVIKKTNKYPYKRFNLLCAISANKVIGWELYPERKGGVKTLDILKFYDDFIKDKYKTI